jgi:hypothetical protein
MNMGNQGQNQHKPFSLGRLGSEVALSDAIVHR